MGHDIHFLSRLDRASPAHADLALSLYRDPGLVGWILNRARLPEAADRIAISLDAADEGPWALVNREGRFITCLARGMACDLPRVGWGRLQALSGQLEELRQRMEEAVALVGGEPTAGVRRLLQSRAHRLGREEFRAASAIRVLVRRELLAEALEIHWALRDVYPTAQRIKEPRKEHRDLLRTYWESVHYQAHLLVLFAMDGPVGLDEVLDVLADSQRPALSWLLFRHVDRALALRAAWIDGRLGRHYLPALKRAYRTSLGPLDWLHRLLALLVLGARQPKLRTEISRELKHYDGMGRVALDFILGLPKIWLEIAYVSLMAPDAVWPDTVSYCQRLAVDCARHYHLAPPYDFQDPDAVPEDLALSLAMNLTGDFLRKPEDVLGMLALVPHLARVEAEQLYLPRAFIEATEPEWQPQDTVELVRRQRTYYGEGIPIQRSAPKVGRNEPCPCGSGRKFKRCCGEATPGSAGPEGVS